MGFSEKLKEQLAHLKAIVKREPWPPVPPEPPPPPPSLEDRIANLTALLKQAYDFETLSASNMNGKPDRDGVKIMKDILDAFDSLKDCSQMSELHFFLKNLPKKFFGENSFSDQVLLIPGKTEAEIIEIEETLAKNVRQESYLIIELLNTAGKNHA